jgi:biotin operon repressor
VTATSFTVGQRIQAGDVVVRVVGVSPDGTPTFRRVARGTLRGDLGTRQQAVLRELHEYGAATRAQLAEHVGASSTAAWQAIRSLMTRGLVVESGGVTGHRGRRQPVYALADGVEVEVDADGRTVARIVPVRRRRIIK